MTKPEQPQQQPRTPTKEATVHPDHAPNGVPDGADTDAKGTPNSDRQASETAGKE